MTTQSVTRMTNNVLTPEEFDRALLDALKSIGTTGLTAPPPGIGEEETLYHGLLVARYGFDFFEGQKDTLTNTAESILRPTAEAMELLRHQTTKLGRGTKRTLRGGKYYELALSSKQPRLYLNELALRDAMKEEGLAQEVIDRIIDKGTLVAKVPVSITAHRL